METIKSFAAESATVIVGTVYDKTLEDQMRLTIVATGLGVQHAGFASQLGRENWEQLAGRSAMGLQPYRPIGLS